MASKPLRVPLPDDYTGLRTRRLERFGCIVTLEDNGDGTGRVLVRPLHRDGWPVDEPAEVHEPDGAGPDRDAVNAMLAALGVKGGSA